MLDPARRCCGPRHQRERSASRASATRRRRFPPHMIVTSPAVIRTYAAADQTGKGCRLALGALGGDPPWCSATARWRPLRYGLARASVQPPRHLERDLRTRPCRRRPPHRRGGRCVDDESPRRRPGERPYPGRHRRQRPRPHGITGPNRCRAVPPGSRAWPWPLLAAPPVWRVARLPSESARGRPRGRR
jgi:hypothetical protein